MAEAIRMPKMSDTMLEGVIANWNVKVGDKVKVGDILAEVETDKATMDMETYYDGTILYIGIEKGKAVPIDALIAIIGSEGEDFSALLADKPTETKVEIAIPVIADTVPVVAVQVSTEKVNANAIRMPKMSDTMIEGTIHTWLKKVGDTIKTGDILAEVETDKATMELESFEDGTLLYIGVGNGESILVDGIIAIVGEEGSNWQLLLNDNKVAKPVAIAPITVATTANVVTQSTPTPPTPAQQAAPVQTISSDGRLMASPLAKALAADKGIKLQDLQGSGEGGRIVKRDIDNYTPKVAAVVSTTPSNSNAGVESFEDLPLSQMRKVIARRLSESKFSAPEFYLTMEINMDKAMAARTSMNEISPVKISFNDMVIKAAAMSLVKHPAVNSAWMGDKIRRNHHVHIGMAVAVEDGLLVPVIRFANTKTMSQIATETKDLGGKAKNKQLQPKDWEGNTFSISNLGMMGIDEFTSIINPPESCIMAVGGIKETVAVKDGQFYATNIMKVTLTCDHRVVDGATGANFLVTFKQLLEDPIKILV
jgi:pyruvate dehydrogenase E2 component (dihydrolipoamide acetyltransferase)